MAFDQYLAEVRAATEPALLSADMTEELRGHLEDAAYDLQLAGMRPEESEQEAIRRVGQVEVVARAFQREHRHSLSAALLRHPRSLLAAAALATSLLGGAAAATAHSQHPGIPTTQAAHQAPLHR